VRRLSRRRFLRGLSAGAVALAGPKMLMSAPSPAGGRRPNVIIVITDDQGYGDLSCHGNPAIKTPVMDRLRAESVRLTDFHVAPMCSPTRGQLMTGCDAMRNGASAVCQGRSMMRNSLPTLADVFRGSGYATGHFGKWHLGDSYPHRPQDRGFDETVHHAAWGITSLADYSSNDYWDDTYRHNGKLQKYDGYCTDVWFAEAMKWMQARHDERKSFFCYLATNCPHSPHLAPEAFVRPYKTPGLPAPFYGQIANIDANLDKLLKWMDEQRLAEDTILIFMTDNGTAAGEKVFNAGMRGKKCTLWEGGHRVPCFIRWPAGGLGKPRDIDALTECQDILPTLIDLCGMKAPPEAKFDGVSLAALLTGKADVLVDRMLVVQYGAAPRKGSATIMWNKWRLVKGKLYDLRTDPHQDKDVSAEHPDVAAAMARHYEKWWKGVQGPFAETRWILLGSEKANPVVLYSSDWDGMYADNRPNLIAGKAKGAWTVKVERPGRYRFTLWRWWPEANWPLSAGYGGKMHKGRGAVPIDSGGVKIGGVDMKVEKAGDHDASVSLTGELQPGQYRLKTMFYNEKGKALCGAFYTKVERL